MPYCRRPSQNLGAFFGFLQRSKNLEMLEKDLRESQSPLPPPLPARTASRPTVLETSAAEGSWQSQWAGSGAGGRPRCDIDSAAAELGGDATPTSERSNSRPSSGGQLSSPAAASAAATAGVSNPVRRPSCPLQSPRIVNGTPLTGLSKSPSTRETSSNRPMVVLAAPRKYSLPCDMLDRPLPQPPVAVDAYHHHYYQQQQNRAGTLGKLDVSSEATGADDNYQQPRPPRSVSPCPSRPLPPPPLPARPK